MATAHCKTCGQWCEEDDVYCSKECEGVCEECDGEGKVICSSCQGTSIGQFGDPDTSKCSTCGGSGMEDCGCDEEDYDYDFLRKERLEGGRP